MQLDFGDLTCFRSNFAGLLIMKQVECFAGGMRLPSWNHQNNIEFVTIAIDW